MENNISGAVICFAVGLVLSVVNYKISDFVLKKAPDKYAFVSVLRQSISVIYLVAVFFTAKYFPCDRTYLLIGAALGVTVPMFLFTGKLLKNMKK